MIQLREIDENGLFVSDVINPVIEEGHEHLYISTPVPQGFYHPKWNGSEWVEGMSQEQIDELQNQPVEPSQEERIEFLEQDNAYLFYDSMAKETRINELETMNAELTYLIMTGGL